MFDLSRLLRSGLVIKVGSVATVKLGGTAIAFGVQVALARQLDPAQFGIYNFAFSVVMILALVGCLGADRVALREIKAAIATSRSDDGCAVLSWAVKRTALLGLLAGLALLGASFLIDEPYGPAMTVAAILVPVFAGIALARGILRGLDVLIPAIAPDMLLRPLLLLTLLLVLSPATATEALGIHAFAAIAIAVLSGWLVSVRRPKPIHNAESQPDVSGWRDAGVSMFWTAAMLMVITQGNIIIAGALLSPEETGQYSLSLRLANFATIALVAINMIVAPMISGLFAQERIAELQRVISLACTLVFGTSLAILLCSYLFVDTILGLFGEGYKEARMSLLILMVGQTVSAFFGPVGQLLTMTRFEQDAAKIITVCAIVGLVLSVALASLFGVMGLALASAGVTIFWNAAMFVAARRRCGVTATPFGSLL